MINRLGGQKTSLRHCWRVEINAVTSNTWL